MSEPRRTGGVTSAALLLAIMFAGSVGLWVGVPVAWFWIGGRLQAAGASLAAALGVIAVGILVSIVLAVRVLGWLSEKHAHARARRGLDDLGNVPLEGVMVVSALVALVTFVVWFFVFSGAEPLPLSLPE